LTKDFKVKTYPNPTANIVMVEFELDAVTNIEASLYSAAGILVKKLYRDIAKRGKNMFSFSTEPLANGIYLLKIADGQNLLINKQIVKQ
jgi:hypothetical protein